MLNTFIEKHGDQQLRLARLGSGDAVILLHGYPDNLQVFSRLAPLLATHHEVLAFDWPGEGYSQVQKGGATPVAAAKKLLALMDDWGIKQAHIAGHDMGGQPALVFAALYPERTKSVVVMNALVAGDSDTSWEIKWLRKFGLNKLAMRYFKSIVFRRALYTFLSRNYRLDPAIRNDMWQAFRRPEVRRFIVRMCAGYEGQLSRLPRYYTQITCPAFILWGGRDKHFPPLQAAKLHEYMPHAQLKIIKDGTHWMALERGDDVAAEMEAFYTHVAANS